MITKFNISWQIICIFSKSHLLTVVRSFILLSNNVMSLIALTNINQITSHHLFLCSCGISIEKWISEPQVIVTLMFSKRVSRCWFCWSHLYWVSCLVYLILFFIWNRSQEAANSFRTSMISIMCVMSMLLQASLFSYTVDKKIPLCILQNYTRMKHDMSIMKCLSGCVVVWVLILDSLRNIYFVFLVWFNFNCIRFLTSGINCST